VFLFEIAYIQLFCAYIHCSSSTCSTQSYDISTHSATPTPTNKQTNNFLHQTSSSAHATRQTSPTPVLIASTSHPGGTSRSRNASFLGFGCSVQGSTSRPLYHELLHTTHLCCPCRNRSVILLQQHRSRPQHTKPSLRGNTPAALLTPSVSWHYGGHRKHCRPLQGR
jgi:hypothetical protein